MRTNRKTEEKKMSMNKNIARLAVTAGLTVALSFGGVMAPVTMAFAEEGAAPSYSLTINQDADNGPTSFKAYQIFTADVMDGKSGKVTSNVEWASPAARTAVLDELVNNKATGITKDSTASDVADYLSKITDTTDTTSLPRGSILNKIALAVEKNVTATGNSFAAGCTFTTTSAGYYLFMTDTDSLNTKEKQTGTSPIFAVVGGGAVSVTEKTSIPTVTKQIKDDANGVDWEVKADSQMGQTVQYKLTGTVANNVDTFGTYYYEFYDELSAGLTVDESSVKVVIDKTQITPTSVTVSDPDSNGKTVLSVKFEDLKAAAKAADVPVGENTRVIVTYSAKLDPKMSQHVVVGDTGNSNTVKLIYSNNPGHDTKGESVSDTVRDYTYALKLVKKDATDESKALAGVKFTICATNPDDTTSKGMYVQDNGSLDKEPYEFTTTDSGEINVKGLDAGTYTVKETHTLAGYNTIPDFTFTIKATGLNNAEGVGENKLTVKTSTAGSNLVEVDTTNTDNGTAALIVKNKQGSGLPLTGLNGVTFTWIAGGAVLCIGVAHLIRSRKQAEESEQE